MGVRQTAPNALLYAVAGPDTHAGIQIFPDVRHSLGIIFEPSDQHKMEEAVPTDSVRTELHFLGYRCGDVVHVPGS